MNKENVVLFGIREVPSQRGLQITEAAKYLGMHPQTLRKESDLGNIPCRRIGKHRVFLIEELDSWLNQQPKWVVHGNS